MSPHYDDASIILMAPEVAIKDTSNEAWVSTNQARVFAQVPSAREPVAVQNDRWCVPIGVLECTDARRDVPCRAIERDHPMHVRGID